MPAVHKVNNMKGSIYMVFDYMDHDLTGLMERMNHKMAVPHVSPVTQNRLKSTLPVPLLMGKDDIKVFTSR